MSPTLKDPFDALLISTCTILAKGNGSPDSDNHESQAFSTVASNIPCRVSTAALGRPKEYKTEKQASENYRTIFMRPYAGLTPHHWLQIDGVLYNIFEIKNPSGLNHHFEIIAQVLIP